MGTIHPLRYRQIVLIAGILLGLIVLTGAAVRLTESGLGCEDWPTCNQDQVVPEWQFHGWIEFGNRLLSGIVGVAVGAAALAAYHRRPLRYDLVRLAWGLVALVIAQILLGGATVLLDLHPLVVGVHFLLSMLLLWNVVILWVKADPALDQPDAEDTVLAGHSSPVKQTAAPANSTRILQLSRAVVALAGTTAALGTLVTGTGPHGGDARADRLPFDLRTIAQVHSGAVWCFLATTAALAVSLQRSADGSASRTSAAKTARLVLAMTVAQGAIGYTQYLTGVPPLLVEAHILGAIAVWVGVVLLHQRVEALSHIPFG